MALLVALAGMLGALLPARWWPWIDLYIPATRFALASSIATVLAGGMLGIAGFIEFAQHQAGAVNDVVLSSPEAARAGDDLSTLTLQGVAALSVMAFLLTPQGMAAVYLTVSGIGRAFSAAFVDGMGDPLLTGLERAARGLFLGAAAQGVKRARTIREGPDVPDRIFRGVHLDLGADLVIVSARRKSWDRGTIVRSGERFFRVGEIEERMMHGHLRTLYPLNAVHDHGAIRRLVDYDIPDRYRIGDRQGGGSDDQSTP
jgi:hypothetical protein